jgi:hypothetical protein
MPPAVAPELLERIRELAAQRLSARRIALELADGHSRSSIVGLAHRHGIRLLGVQFRRHRPVTDANGAANVNVLPPLRWTLVTTRAIEQLDWIHGCRWPIGEVGDPEFRYCGEAREYPEDERIILHRYCAHHGRAAHGPPPQVRTRR